MTQSGKLICAETKGDHLKNDDSREKIALGQAWRTAAGKDYRYYMVFENEENLLPGAVSMRREEGAFCVLRENAVNRAHGDGAAFRPRALSCRKSEARAP